MANVLVFTQNNARFVRVEDQTTLNQLKASGRAVVNPDMKDFRGVPMHFLKLVDGKVTLMTDAERQARTFEHEKEGVDNDHLGCLHVKYRKPKKVFFRWSKATIFITSFTTGLLAGFLSRGWF